MLAKDATLTATNTKLDAITTKLNAVPPAPVAVGSVRTIGASNDAVMAAITAKLPTVVFSDTVPECPVFSSYIPFLNFTMTIDQFCTMDSLIRPVLNAMAVFFALLMGFFIIMRA
ncbi:hypothetical protein CCP3SC1AL1_1590003 [Gammaproteobacteria bacterium]